MYGSAERDELERIVACLERLVVLLATAPHLSHILPPAARTASLLAQPDSSAVLDERGGASSRPSGRPHR